MIFLTRLEKEKTCACIQFQINLLSKRIDELETPNDQPMTDEENNELCNCYNAIVFYDHIIKAIRL